MLRNWFYLKPFNERIHVVLEQYLFVSGSTRDKIYSQLLLNNTLKHTTRTIQTKNEGKSKMKQKEKKKLVNDNLAEFHNEHQDVPYNPFI